MLPIDEFGAKGARENKSFTVKLWPNDGSYRGQTMVQVTRISASGFNEWHLKLFLGVPQKVRERSAPWRLGFPRN